MPARVGYQSILAEYRELEAILEKNAFTDGRTHLEERATELKGLLEREFYQIFKPAIEAKRQLKQAYAQYTQLAKQMDQDAEVQSCDERAINYHRIRQLKVVKRTIAKMDIEYERACIDIEKTISYSALVWIANQQQQTFFKHINSNDSSRLQRLPQQALFASIVSYVMQVSQNQHYEQLGFTNQRLSSVWSELLTVRDVCVIAQVLSGNSLDIVLLINPIIKQLESAFMRDLSRTEVEQNRREFQRVKALHAMRTMNIILVLKGLQPATSFNFIDKMSQRIEEFFSSVVGRESTYGLESIIPIQNAVRQLLPLLQQKAREINWDEVPIQYSLDVYSFKRTQESYLKITTERSEIPIVFSRSELLVWFKSIVDWHFDLHKDAISTESSVMQLAINLAKKAPDKVQENETDPSFDYVVHRAEILAKGTIVSYGSWKVWIRSDRYAVVVDGPGCRLMQNHTYASMIEQVLKHSKTLASDVRSFLMTGAIPLDRTDAQIDVARFVVAKFISEPARNWRIWLINIMMLDMLEDGVMLWNDFFELHPMRGGSDTADKKRDQIDADCSQILFNWFVYVWPTNELIGFGGIERLGSDHRTQMALEKHCREEVIIPLMLCRMSHVSKWDHTFMPKEYSGNPRLLQPYRVSGEVGLEQVIWEAAKRTDRLNTVESSIKELWVLEDKSAILDCWKSQQALHSLSVMQLERLSEELNRVIVPKRQALNTLLQSTASRMMLVNAFSDFIQEEPGFGMESNQLRTAVLEIEETIDSDFSKLSL